MTAPTDPTPTPGDPAAITIRGLANLSDFRQCLALQEEIWGPGFTEVVPPSILRVSERTGGTAGGAFDEDDRLVGFVFGLAGMEVEEPIHWSDMLAIRREFRGLGLARRLKCWQRDTCLERGVQHMYWSYDPLESRNAWLNMGRLGAVAREYVPDMYGPGKSPLHQGIGTDRLIALWEMASDRVRRRLAGEEPEPPTWEKVAHLPLAFEVDTDGKHPRPVPGTALPFTTATDTGPEPMAILVPIPADIQQLKEDDPDAALAWRAATRNALAPRLGYHWEIIELVRAEEPVSYYLVRR